MMPAGIRYQANKKQNERNTAYRVQRDPAEIGVSSMESERKAKYRTQTGKMRKYDHQKAKAMGHHHHIIINTRGGIRAGMNDNRLTNNMLSNDKNPEIFIDQKHIIGKITQLFIDIKGLTKKIHTTLVMTLIPEPLDNTLIH